MAKLLAHMVDGSSDTCLDISLANGMVYKLFAAFASI